MASNESTHKTLLVAFLICIVCSIIVSSAAVLLRPVQEKNKLLDKQKNVLASAGLLEEGADIAAEFENIETRYVDLASGNYVEKEQFDQRKAAKDPIQSIALTREQDLASIKRRANVAEIYLALDKNGNVETIILPIHGYGLWSTLYGFIALETDLNTVVGLGFYEHGETPGLGGEVDNPRWKALWSGKKLLADTDSSAEGGVSGWTGASATSRDNTVNLRVVKGKVDPASTGAEHKIDGLSGATLTSNGVSNIIQFWMGENGFGPFIEKSIDQGF